MTKLTVRLPKEIMLAINQLISESGIAISKSEIARLALKLFLSKSKNNEIKRLLKLNEARELKKQLDELFALQKAMLAHGSYVRQAANKYAISNNVSGKERQVLRKILALREKLAHRMAELLDELLPNEFMEPIITDKSPFLHQVVKQKENEI